MNNAPLTKNRYNKEAFTHSLRTMNKTSRARPFIIQATPLTPLVSPLFQAFGVTVYMKREELNHPEIQGNKWHKLRLNLQMAHKQNKKTLLTFGGAYSNHIAATAVAAQEAGLNSIGIIRGQELAHHRDRWSHTLKYAAQRGMAFQFITRAQYREKSLPHQLNTLQKKYPDAYILPEGGSNALAVKGFEPLMHQIDTQCPDWTHLFTSVGTGATFAGLINYAQHIPNRTLLGVAALKQGEHLLPSIQNWITQKKVNQWQLLTQYHYGGYAKRTKLLQTLMQQFERTFQIPLDPIYTAKMVAAFYDLLQKNALPPGSKIILLHTGGLQGRLQQTRIKSSLYK